MERLDKFLADRSEASRSQVKQWIKEGRVKVGNHNAKDGVMKIDPAKDEIYLNGVLLSNVEHQYLMLNKPAGVVSATKDENQPTVLSLVPPVLWRKGLFPAGRLDKDTVGMMILTNDGEFAHNILAPGKHVPKTYEAVVDAPVTQEDIKAFEQGIMLRDGVVTQSAILDLIEDGETPRVQVILTQGLYHQIKLMFAQRGKRVLFLKRTAMGNLALDPALPEGQCRIIAPQELQLITKKTTQ